MENRREGRGKRGKWEIGETVEQGSEEVEVYILSSVVRFDSISFPYFPFFFFTF